MKTINHLFTSAKRLSRFIVENDIDANQKHFIQVFIGDNNPSKLSSVQETILELLPLSSCIGVSTAGEIIEGGMSENSTVISITTFEATNVQTKLIEHDLIDTMVENVITLTSQETKLILVFNNVYSNDGEKFIKKLQAKIPNIILAGGNAGDNGEFSHQTVVGAGKEVSTTSLSVAIFDSRKLQVFNDLLFNWQTIGESMKVTKARDNTIYEINNQKTQEIYRHFLGEDVASSLPLSAVEFPLIFNENGFDIARAPVAIGKDGELIMAGHTKEGEVVRFGFCDVVQNDINVKESVLAFSKNPVESIFIYSCSARKYFLKNHLNAEFEMLQKIAPTSGFITYGEFFSQDCCSRMLNVSSTIIGLSESETVQHSISLESQEQSSTIRTIHALTHLVKQTSKNIEDKNLRLSQFKHLIQEATLYSSTNKKGIITEVNDRFVELSGYSREELIGKNHNIIRAEDMPKEVYQDLWSTIKSKKSWQGIIKNRAKDGTFYYVRAHIFPIVNTQGTILEYISIRNDITQEIQKQKFLEGSLLTLQETSHEKEYLLNQYENIINFSNAFLRVDSQYNIIYNNDLFCNIYCNSNNNLKNKKVTEILEEKFYIQNFQSIESKLLEKGTWSGVFIFKREDNSLIYMNTSANTIYDKDNNLVEIMMVMHDITDLTMAKKEIEDTQKDVVYTMGAIGETRSRETGNHVKRVAEYSKLFALYYGLSREKAELLKMASPMHDIGKVGIPDSILNKEGPLDAKEWKIMKTHSSLGYSMLRHSKRKILKTAAIVAYTHHEKWDGTGYPKGMKDRAIHIFGRITAIADVFDALGSDRCYKKAWSDEKIFALIREERGKHFDPKLVDIFFAHLDSFLKVRDTFKD